MPPASCPYKDHSSSLESSGPAIFVASAFAANAIASTHTNDSQLFMLLDSFIRSRPHAEVNPDKRKYRMGVPTTSSKFRNIGMTIQRKTGIQQAYRDSARLWSCLLNFTKGKNLIGHQAFRRPDPIGAVADARASTRLRVRAVSHVSQRIACCVMSLGDQDGSINCSHSSLAGNECALSDHKNDPVPRRVGIVVQRSSYNQKPVAGTVPVQIKVAIHNDNHRVRCGHVGRQTLLVECIATRWREHQICVLRDTYNEII